jgi:hypothetical protein
VTLVYIVLNSLTAGLLFGGDFVLTIFSFVGGLAAIYGVRLYRKRYRAATLRAGFIVLPPVNALLLLAFYLILRRSSLAVVPAEVAMGVLGGAAPSRLPSCPGRIGPASSPLQAPGATNSISPSSASSRRRRALSPFLIVAPARGRRGRASTRSCQGRRLTTTSARPRCLSTYREPNLSSISTDLTPSMSTLVIKNYVGRALSRPQAKPPRPLREIIERIT